MSDGFFVLTVTFFIYIPETPISELKASGKITIETIREGRTWKTRFTLKVDALRKEVLTLTRSQFEIKKRFLDVLRRVSIVGFPVGLRNEGAFMLSLGLKVSGFSENQILADFARCFSLSQHVGDHRFSEKEMLKTVKSALKDKYRYCVGFKNEKWLRFLKVVTRLECGILRKIETESGPALNMAGGETWQSQRM